MDWSHSYFVTLRSIFVVFHRKYRCQYLISICFDAKIFSVKIVRIPNFHLIIFEKNTRACTQNFCDKSIQSVRHSICFSSKTALLTWNEMVVRTYVLCIHKQFYQLRNISSLNCLPNSFKIVFYLFVCDTDSNLKTLGSWCQKTRASKCFLFEKSGFKRTTYLWPKRRVTVLLRLMNR